MFESRLFSPVFAAFLCLCPAISALAAEARLSAPGASDGFADKLRAGALSLKAAEQPDSTAQDLIAAARADYARLTGVLYAAGYYGGIVSVRVDGREAADIPPLSDIDRVDEIAITVDRGRPFRFTAAELGPRAPGTELPEGFAIGQQARGELILAAAEQGIRAWRDAGHAKAAVAQQQITADHRTHGLDARLRLAPGPRLRFGDLRVPEDGKVRPGRIRAIAGLPTGTTFSPEALRDASERLRRTGAFRSVALQEAETPGPDATLDITAKLADAKQRRVGIGVELASFEGFTVSTFWLHRNLLGGAESFRIEGEVGGIGGDSGGIDYRLATRFDRPATFAPDTGLFLHADIEQRDDPDYSERSAELGGGLTRIFSDTLTGEAGVTLRYTEIDDDLGKRSITHLLFPARLTWDRRDDALDARKGSYLDLQADPFFGLDESSTGVRLFGDARVYREVGAQNGLVLAARAQIGAVSGPAVADIPPGMLFYSGGAGTVRGQPYQDLNVDLGGGVEVGGRSFFGFSGELRKDIGDKFQAVAFADTGFIGPEAWRTEDGEWHSGAGLGARYKTGVGPIRVDIGTPLDGDAGRDFEIYIGIGQAF